MRLLATIAPGYSSQRRADDAERMMSRTLQVKTHLDRTLSLLVDAELGGGFVAALLFTSGIARRIALVSASAKRLSTGETLGATFFISLPAGAPVVQS
jgi:hypothetical protein